VASQVEAGYRRGYCSPSRSERLAGVGELSSHASCDRLAVRLTWFGARGTAATLA